MTRQIAPSDWERAELEAESEPMPPRERLFPRKVLIGWALFALAMYFGVRIVTSVVKESVKAAVVNTAEKSGQKEIIYKTRNGRITISRNKPNGSISITTAERPGRPSKTIVIPGAAGQPAQPAPPKR